MQKELTEKEKTTARTNRSDRISSPDRLTDYLRVTNPGIWIFLAGIILLLAGIIAWSSVGTLETVIPVKINVEKQQALIISENADTLTEGMLIRVSSDEYTIRNTGTDEYGRIFGVAEIALPDGIYSGTAVTEQMHPIRFLLESW